MILFDKLDLHIRAGGEVAWSDRRAAARARWCGCCAQFEPIAAAS